MAISVEEDRAMTEEQLQETITEIAFEIIANVGAVCISRQFRKPRLEILTEPKS
mgnify:CR=1 FL=1